jgi:hypothetical protein
MTRENDSSDGHATPYPAMPLICRIRMRTLRTPE